MVNFFITIIVFKKLITIINLSEEIIILYYDNYFIFNLFFLTIIIKKLIIFNVLKQIKVLQNFKFNQTNLFFKN